jgi:biopolymer transport protein ExbD
VAKVSNNLIDQSAIDSSDANFIKPLFDQLEEVNKKDPKLAKMGKVLLQADESLPYSTIRKIMYTASMAGFPNVKLITTVGN